MQVTVCTMYYLVFSTYRNLHSLRKIVLHNNLLCRKYINYTALSLKPYSFQKDFIVSGLKPLFKINKKKNICWSIVDG